MNRQAINTNTGFTLIELLIAILIFSILIFTLFASFRAFIFSSQAVKEDLENNEKSQIVFKTMSRDLEAIYILQPPRYKKPEFNSEPDPYRFLGKEMTVGQQAVSFMSFTSLSHAALGLDQRTGVARIAYYMKENQNHTYDLFRADALWPFPQELESCNDPLLCKELSGFEVIYTDVNGTENKNWDSDAEEFKHTLPASIEVKLIFGFGEKMRVSQMTIDLATKRMPIE